MFTLNCKGRLLVIERPLVMGIINVTPDSFYSPSRHHGEDDVLREAERMINEGADILDVGGQSSRPGSVAIGVNEELQRVLRPVEAIAKAFPQVFISIDTWQARVAKEACAAGASIINDISAGSMDPDMIKTVAELGLPYILMHMKGTPSTMQLNPEYDDLTRELLDFFIERCHSLETAGVRDIIIDPGFGFGKTAEHNFELLRNLSVFQILKRPILLGVSRKSTIARILDISVDESLNGTTVLNTIGLMNGASILRVHDVKQAVEAVKLFAGYNKA